MTPDESRMFHFKGRIDERRNAVLTDWAHFLKDRSPFVIAEVIERSNTELPNDFTPWAPGIVTPSDYLLRAVGSRLGGWECTNPGVYRKILYGNKLLVRGCGEFWTIERQIETTLAYKFGPLPIFARTHDAAMQLAEYCHLPGTEDEPYHASPRGVASSLRWVVSTPDGVRWC